MKRLAGVAALLLALGTAFGAFGAHALRGVLDAYSMGIFERALFYQTWSAVGLLALAAFAKSAPGVLRGGWTAFAGTLVFSGTLYLLALTGVKWWGAVTPIGGVLMIIGWSMAAWSFFRSEPVAP
ncbi:MAG: DUF423 domain-containing protein [Fimbriimonadaceae bacterium]|nr:DUF423 domain-containing protein [Fimbriimonadaceae bacterium]QYK55705.1 MAG: DUF423 domain-containing protein [Fimbriimonadaceae bacterium]